MSRIIFTGAIALLGASAIVSPIHAQPTGPSAGADQERCARMREAFAKHPAPNAAAEARRQQRLADCEAGKAPAADPAQSDQTGDGQPSEPGQPAGAGDAGTGNGGAPTVTVAPTSSAVGRPGSGGTASRMAIAPSANLANAVPTFTGLRFAVLTADDDLRSDSRAWVTVQPPGGAAQQCLLKEGDMWFENNSSNSKSCNLNVPLTADQLRATRFVLEYDGEPGAIVQTGEDAAMSMTHGYDNWKVKEIRVAATGQGEDAQCLMDAKGAPLLVELKQENRRFELSGGC
jgi:hypothetical protein